MTTEKTIALIIRTFVGRVNVSTFQHTVLTTVNTVKVKVSVAQSIQLFATLWTVDLQAPLSMELSGKNNGLGCHFLLQGIFPTQGLNPYFLHWHPGSLPFESPGLIPVHLKNCDGISHVKCYLPSQKSGGGTRNLLVVMDNMLITFIMVMVSWIHA